MLKQLLTGGSVLALLLLGSLAAQANPIEPRFQSQAPSTSPAPDGTTTPGTTPDGTTTPETTPDGTTTPGTTPDGTTTPGTTPDGTTTPGTTPDGTTTSEACKSLTPTSPTGGGTRERLQAGCINP